MPKWNKIKNSLVTSGVACSVIAILQTPVHASTSTPEFSDSLRAIFTFLNQKPETSQQQSNDPKTHDLKLVWGSVEGASHYQLEELKNGVWSKLGAPHKKTEQLLTGYKPGLYEFRLGGCVEEANVKIHCGENVAEFKGAKITLGVQNSPSAVTTVPLAQVPGNFMTEDASSTQIGTVAGQFRVSESGAATYSVPVSLPKGIAGVTPELSLNYNSSAGNGPLGLGWSLSGLSAISRCRQTQESDGKTTALSLTNEDRFCLNGQKLIAVKGNYGEDGTEYRTELASQQRITSKGTTGKGPSYFIVEGVDGSVTYYGEQDIAGNRTDAVMKAGDTILNWRVTSISDNLQKEKSSIRFRYITGNGSNGIGANETVISSISYGNHEVTFNYHNNPQRSDMAVAYVHGVKIIPTALLEHINVTTTIDNTRLRQYTLSYDEDNSQKNKRITSILEKGIGGTSIHQTQFSWQPNPTSGAGNFKQLSLGSDDIITYTMIDINGDSFQDFVYIAKSNDSYVIKGAINNKGTLSTPVNISTSYSVANDKMTPVLLPGDVDGDGALELLYFRKLTSSAKVDTWYILDRNDNKNSSLGIEAERGASFKDLNADALPELLVYKGDNVRYFLNNQGTFSQQVEAINVEFPNWKENNDPNVETKIKLVEIGPQHTPLDINGDGRSDIYTDFEICEIEQSQSGSREECGGGGLVIQSLYQNNGKYEFKITKELNRLVKISKALVGDINGDGLSDTVFHHGQLSTGLGFNSLGVVTAKTHDGKDLLDKDIMGKSLLDINRDGALDYIYFDKNNSRWQALLFDKKNNKFATSATIFNHVANYKKDEGDVAFLSDWDGDAIPGFARLSLKDKKLFYQHDWIDAKAAPENRIVNITNGFGVKTQIQYSMLNDGVVYQKGTGAKDLKYGRCQYIAPLGQNCSPVYDLISPQYVVSKVTSDAPGFSADGSSYNKDDTVSVQYQYFAQRAQAGGRGLLGFEKISTYDPERGVTTDTLYHQAFPFSGMPKATISYFGQYQASALDKEGNTSVPESSRLKYSRNTYGLQRLQSDKVLAPYLSQSNEEQYVLQSETTSAKTGRIVTTQEYSKHADNHLNLTKSEIVTFENANGQEKEAKKVTTTNTYTQEDISAGKWWLNRVSTTSVEHLLASKPEAVVGTPRLKTERSSKFVYNKNGMLGKEIIQPLGSNTEKLATLHCYDDMGNKTGVLTYAGLNTEPVSCTQAAPSDLNTNNEKVFRKQTTEYDSYNRANKSHNGVFETSEVKSFNSYQQPLQTKDANGVITNIAYDAMGRQFASSNNLGQGKRTTRRLASDAAAIGAPVLNNIMQGITYFVERTETLGKPSVYAYFDKMGRKVATVTPDFTANQWIYQYTKYDKWGQAIRQSVPSTSNSANDWHSTKYNKFGRVEGGVAADGTKTEVSYNGFTTTTRVISNTGGSDIDQTQVETKNILGQTVKMQDAANGIISYAYDATGNLIQVTNVDNSKIVTSFDDLGRKTAMTDPNKGKWQYKYNALGEMIEQTSSRGYVTKTYRDALGRTTKREVTAGTPAVNKVTSYNYQKQLLVSETDSKVSKHYEYDSFGRIDLLKTTLDNNKTYTQQTTYDQHGRVFQQFDAAEGVQGCFVNGSATGACWGTKFNYSNHGYLVSQEEARYSASSDPELQTVYQEITDRDHFGNVLTLKQNKGKIKTVKTYHPQMGTVTSIQATHKASNQILQENKYKFDGLGNLKSRDWATVVNMGDMKQLPENDNRWGEVFKYDNLNRVTHINSNERVAYHANGNINWKHIDGSNKYYCYNSSRPHALAGLGSSANCTSSDYQYDANGNMIKGKTVTGVARTISYSHFDKPVTISANGTTSFAYDTQRKRYKRVTTESKDGKSETTTTYYIGNVEIVSKSGSNVVQTRRYLPGAIRTHGTDGSDQTRYLVKDHLGSIGSITNEDGKLVEKLYFDAWGKKHSIPEAKWQVNAAVKETSANLQSVLNITPRGFTGHEHVDHADIIHMNGRIYDPSLGRFLQADPFIQAPKNSQSYNRYSYLMNSPLSGTDPSGYFGLSFFKKISRGIIRGLSKVFGPQVVSIAGNIASYFCGPAAAACAGYWNYEFTRAMGGSVFQALKGAFTAFTATLVFQDIGARFRGFSDTNVNAVAWEGAQLNSFYDFGGNLLTGAQVAQQVASHAVAGGVISTLSGGKFGHGFFSAGVTKGAGGAFLPSGSNLSAGEVAKGTVISAVIGGTASAIVGGKFANGARTASLQYLFNQAVKSASKPKKTTIFGEATITSAGYKVGGGARLMATLEYDVYGRKGDFIGTEVITLTADLVGLDIGISPIGATTFNFSMTATDIGNFRNSIEGSVVTIDGFTASLGAGFSYGDFSIGPFSGNETFVPVFGVDLGYFAARGSATVTSHKFRPYFW